MALQRCLVVIQGIQPDIVIFSAVAVKVAAVTAQVSLEIAPLDHASECSRRSSPINQRLPLSSTGVNTLSLAHDLQYAADLARGAGKIILQQYGNVERLTKTHAAAHEEAVTAADRASQRFIVAGLRPRYPDDGIVGEESDSGESITFESNDPNGRHWVIDPIDGTNNFIAGLGAFCVCIGLIDRGEPVLGVV
jgi:hypothetical protein